MDRQGFESFLSSKYEKLVAYFTKRGYQEADAADYVHDYAVWGLQKEWEEGETHGMADAITRIKNVIRDNNARLSVQFEIPLGKNEDDDNDDVFDVSSYDFCHLFSENEQRNTEEFEELAGSIIGEYQSSITEQAILDRMSILTDRQLDVLYLVEKGMNQEQIASALGVEQPAICKSTQRAIERLYTAYPELSSAGPLWTKDEIKAQKEAELKRQAMYADTRPCINFVGFALDTYEVTGRHCLPYKLHDDCECARCTESDNDTEVDRVSRAFSAQLSQGYLKKPIQLAKKAGYIPRLYAPKPHVPGTPPVAQGDKPTDTELLRSICLRNIFTMSSELSARTLAKCYIFGILEGEKEMDAIYRAFTQRDRTDVAYDMSYNRALHPDIRRWGRNNWDEFSKLASAGRYDEIARCAGVPSFTSQEGGE